MGLCWLFYESDVVQYNSKFFLDILFTEVDNGSYLVNKFGIGLFVIYSGSFVQIEFFLESIKLVEWCMCVYNEKLVHLRMRTSFLLFDFVWV